MRKENFEDTWEYLQSTLAANGCAGSVPGSWTDIWEELIDRAPRLLLPLAMDTFDTDYAGDEAMIIMDPPDLSSVMDPMLRKSTTDVRFGVKESDTMLRRYHVAALDTLPPTMTTYMMAYNFCDATEFADELDGRLIFQWPRSIVLCFNGGDTSPRELPMHVGDSAAFDGIEIPPVPVVNASAGTVEEILEHDLLVLLPFFLQRYRQDMRDLDKDSAWLSEVESHYRLMACSVLARTQDGSLSVDDAAALGDAILYGVRTAAEDHPHVQEMLCRAIRENLLDSLL